MIDIQKLSFSYGDKQILHDLSLRLQPGDFCALLGPNGAGKSTLLYSLMGYIKPSAGVIKIHGKDIAHLKRSSLARLVAFIPQESSAEFDHTVFDTVLMGRFPYLGLLQAHSAEDRKAVDITLELLGLSDLRMRWLSQLSGGEKQRVLIARALVQETPFILLDESLSQLDINHQIEIMSLLKQINRQQGKAVLIVSHNLNLAANYADKLIFIKDGRLLATGTAQALMQSHTLHQLFGVHLDTVTNPNSGRPNMVYP